MLLTYRNQKTLAQPISYSGIGVHTGESVTIRLCPEEEDRGIYFKRVDLPGAPMLAASCQIVSDTERCTTLGKGEASVQTVEHLLAAIRAYEIDNLCIEINANEPPIGDGSSAIFVELIEKAGVIQQKGEIPILQLQEPLYLVDGDSTLVALPSETYRISYTLHYPGQPLLEAQYFSLQVNTENFKTEIAPCRTFALYEEVKTLKSLGLIKGGGLENAVLIKGEHVVNPEGLRFSNEMARHKILDIVGDLSLIGFEFTAHIIAVRSGHRSNVLFAKQLYKYFAQKDHPVLV